VIISAAVAAPAILLGAAVPAFADTSPAPAVANHHALTADSDDADGGGLPADGDASPADGGASMPDSHHFDASSDDPGDYGNPWGDYSDVFGNSSSAEDSDGGGPAPSYPRNGPNGADGVAHGRLPLLGG
jgi:hypothetical protein